MARKTGSVNEMCARFEAEQTPGGPPVLNIRPPIAPRPPIPKKPNLDGVPSTQGGATNAPPPVQSRERSQSERASVPSELTMADALDKNRAAIRSVVAGMRDRAATTGEYSTERVEQGRTAAANGGARAQELSPTTAVDVRSLPKVLPSLESGRKSYRPAVLAPSPGSPPRKPKRPANVDLTPYESREFT
ncbi:PREDICTED: uncharacterized protein LOC106809931 [Priapulus caudatus]|uniref:Uncharacterized protein LOC106809931 n=1 Tax=Priapulus caudatus TaxID=37621 RepID=A0ABM1E8Y4_PRICU|nr:PREDICTED: uncharacterized protein LOC106809931 [Priapulus caudatus]